ncbi:MAG: tetraacyldisaccharide 4'-kinase [Planctomycetota bacterium]
MPPSSRRRAIDPSLHQQLIRGERRGAFASLARGILWLLSLVFRVIVAVRGWLYDAGLLRRRQAGLPVISIGNLTTGGTGKTPVVIALARRLTARGERVAVLARGYGAARDGELNDELRLIGREVPEAILCPGKDRVARAAEAVSRGATAILLDDGFQHRRLARDLDLVLLDATDPWGAGHLLPRGLLREPPGALARADAVILSRAELKSASELDALEAQVRGAGFAGPVLRMRVEPARLERLHPEPADLELGELAGKAVLLACGVGNPNAVAATAARLGVRTSQVQAFPDHHEYDGEDVLALEELASRRALGHVLVTAKDAVKLAPLLPGRARLTWLCLGVEARLEPVAALDALLDRPAPQEAP